MSISSPKPELQRKFISDPQVALCLAGPPTLEAKKKTPITRVVESLNLLQGSGRSSTTSNEILMNQSADPTGCRYNEMKGQSPWYDNLCRPVSDLLPLIASGVRGVTSNPVIFQKALSSSNVYNDQFKYNLELVQSGKDIETAYWELVVKDIQDACKLFECIYDQTDGGVGYVSVEVSPGLADDTEGTVEAAKWLHKVVDRSNVHIKIPATKPCIQSIKEVISLGISINVTVIFSLARYEAVIDAYLDGFEASGLNDLSRVSSVASLFVSRVEDEMMIKMNQSADPTGCRYNEMKGQSPWYDNLCRLVSNLLLLIASGVRGVTSNPVIFQNALSSSNVYDDQFKYNLELVQSGKDIETAYWELVVKDIQGACKLFECIYDQTDGGVGYVSVEVSPGLADDTEGTVEAAKWLHKVVDRSNVHIKIPATKPCIQSIKEVISLGISINVTVIFSLARYEAVIDAYLDGFEASGLNDLSRVSSVASLFVGSGKSARIPHSGSSSSCKGSQGGPSGSSSSCKGSQGGPSRSSSSCKGSQGGPSGSSSSCKGSQGGTPPPPPPPPPEEPVYEPRFVRDRDRVTCIELVFTLLRGEQNFHNARASMRHPTHPEEYMSFRLHDTDVAGIMKIDSTTRHLYPPFYITPALFQRLLARWRDRYPRAGVDPLVFYVEQYLKHGIYLHQNHTCQQYFEETLDEIALLAPPLKKFMRRYGGKYHTVDDLYKLLIEQFHGRRPRLKITDYVWILFRETTW